MDLVTNFTLFLDSQPFFFCHMKCKSLSLLKIAVLENKGWFGWKYIETKKNKVKLRFNSLFPRVLKKIILIA